MADREVSSFEYYQGQAKFLGAAGLLIRNNQGDLLLVKPSYKSVWHLPGGMMESGETPQEAARREAREEIGLDLSVGRMLCVDYKSSSPERPACIQFIFDGGILSAEDIEAIEIDARELNGWRFVSEEDAVAIVASGGPAARLVNSFDALRGGATVYLEDGQIK